MEQDRISLLVAVARMYYENNYNQVTIANKLNISRPYVSKLLQEAYTLGIVDIQIKDPMTHETSLEKRIRTTFGLERVFVIPCTPGEGSIPQVSSTGAKYLDSILKDNDIIGISNGSTMYQFATHAVPRDNLENLKIVQMMGSYTNLRHHISTTDNVCNLANALGATPYALPLPIFLQSATLCHYLSQDKNIQRIQQFHESINIAIFSVGTLGTIGTNSLVNSGFLTQEQLEDLYLHGAVGDICSHFIDKNGNLCDYELDSRNTSIPLNTLKQIKTRICLASGRSRLNILHAALIGGYVTVLITDEELAKGLISSMQN